MVYLDNIQMGIQNNQSCYILVIHQESENIIQSD